MAFVVLVPCFTTVLTQRANYSSKDDVIGAPLPAVGSAVTPNVGPSHNYVFGLIIIPP
ncbi:unnamed protein product [Penicillium roqueforti FM164]|uniref:Uncharacterized protein n=1 Tax=Penicillium roqueforti (strain FM164) TaxID=1365484 RepID=W6QUI2_PENRF|nr:unnamed protein product [Penicillium roqueforti FM164]